MKQKEITILREQQILGKEFTVYGDIFEPLFLAKDVADMIEHSDVSKMVKAVDDDEKVKNSILTLGGSQEMWFLTEAGLYEVLMQSRKPVARQFKKEVKAILKDLRLNGCVITESATEESVNYQLKYGKWRLPRTFRESTDLRATYEEYATLSKLERDAHRIDNEGRIRNCKAILDIIETRIAENLTHMRGSEVLALRELALDVQADITKLSNKRNSGIKSAMTKQICLLTEENEQLKNQLYIEDEDEYFLILSHPFSCNYQYSYSNNGIVKSAAYYRWINNLHLEEFLPPAECLDVDFTKPLRITLLYGHKEGMDTSNFGKSIIDQLSEYWQFNDELAIEVIQSLHSYVDSYNEGYIYVKIENI